MHRDSRHFVAVDSQGYKIRINDNMKETEGGLREGRVLHVHQSLYAFLHNRGLLESGGVFVTRAMSLTSVVPRLRPHPLLVGRRHKKIPPTPDFYAGGASPAKLGSIRIHQQPVLMQEQRRRGIRLQEHRREVFVQRQRGTHLQEHRWEVLVQRLRGTCLQEQQRKVPVQAVRP